MTVRKSWFTFFALTSFVAGGVRAEDNQNVEPQRFVCSMSDSYVATEGDFVTAEVSDKDRKPEVLTFPRTNQEHIVDDGYSDDGRFYWYVKYRKEGMKSFSIYGVFDYQQEVLTTSLSHIGSGKDGLTRPYSKSFKWICAKSP